MPHHQRTIFSLSAVLILTILTLLPRPAEGADRIVDQYGEPVGQAALRLEIAPPDGGESRTITVTTDPAGQFTAGPPGTTYRLTAITRNGYRLFDENPGGQHL